MIPAAETCSGRSAGVCARRTVASSSASVSSSNSVSFIALIASYCPLLHGHPHRADPDHLPVGLNAAHIVVTGFALLCGLVAPTEGQDAPTAGGVDNRVVFNDHHTLEWSRAPQAHGE